MQAGINRWNGHIVTGAAAQAAWRLVASLSALGTVTVVALFLTGCGQSPLEDSAQLRAARSRLLLDREPADAVSVLDLRETIATGSTAEVALVGQIGGVPNPWTRGEASFILADPSLLGENSEHDHGTCGDNCPYCKKQKEDEAGGLALVRLVDAAGNVLPHDAQALLGIGEEQTVVVSGRAQLTEQGHLIVAARGIYVRR